VSSAAKGTASAAAAREVGSAGDSESAAMKSSIATADDKASVLGDDHEGEASTGTRKEHAAGADAAEVERSPGNGAIATEPAHGECTLEHVLKAGEREASKAAEDDGESRQAGGTLADLWAAGTTRARG
jgi:hypothetical protein